MEQIHSNHTSPVLSKGYEFFEKIGSPKLIVAPMVDQSELAYRMLTRKYGAQLVYTQMFNAKSFIEAKEYQSDNFRTCIQDRPLIVQFAGHDPQMILKAAKLVENSCDAIDINLGCPQGIAKRGRYGAFLMEELELLSEIVTLLSNNIKIPITCKTRIYKDFNRSIKLCETLVNAGASMLVIHGRTREEKGQMVHECDWEMISKIKQYFNGKVPIIANGGIQSYNDIIKCLEYTKCDGVMTSEAILENPSLFCQNIHPITQKYLTQIDITEEYLSLCEIYPVWHMKTVRSHIMKFLYRYLIQYTEIRDLLYQARNLNDYIIACQELRQLISLNNNNDSDFTLTWYMRYRSDNEDINSRLRQMNKNSKLPVGIFDQIDKEYMDCGEVLQEISDENNNVDNNNENDGIFDTLGMFDED